MTRYQVALWRSFSQTSYAGYPWLPVVVEEVETSSPFLAVLTLMERAHLRYVAHAAVQADDTREVMRYDNVRSVVGTAEMGMDAVEDEGADDR